MGLYKRKRSPFYWMTYKVDGKRVYESTGTKNKKLAEKIYSKVITNIEEGRFFQIESRRRTFEELRERYMEEHSTINKTVSSQTRDVYSFNQLGRFFAKCKLTNVSPSAIASYKTFRRSDGVKPATIAKELELLRNALNLAIREWEWLDTNPFSKIKIEKPNNKIERWLTDEEEQRLLAHVPDWLKPIIVLTLNTGLRRGEVIALKWTDIDLSRKTLTVQKAKNKEKRTIPLNNTILELLKGKGKIRYISGYLFTSEAGTMLDGQNVYKALKNSAKRAGVENLRFHDLRHTFATRLVQSGIDLYVVKELLGHKTLTMTMRYAHHYPESLRHGVDVLDKSGDTMVTLGKKRGAALLGDSSQVIEMTQ